MKFTDPISFGRAVAGHLAAGWPVISEAVRRLRRAACAACPEREPVRDFCTKCNCRLSGPVNKLEMPNQHCPLGKW